MTVTNTAAAAPAVTPNPAPNQVPALPGSAAPEHTLGLVLDYLAAGIDPAAATTFAHSAIPALNQLPLPFLSLVSVPELERDPTVKAEARAAGRPALSGPLLTHPVHRPPTSCSATPPTWSRSAKAAPRLPHLEITRTVASRFNERYAISVEVPLRDAFVQAAALASGVYGEAALTAGLAGVW